MHTHTYVNLRAQHKTDRKQSLPQTVVAAMAEQQYQAKVRLKE